MPHIALRPLEGSGQALARRLGAQRLVHVRVARNAAGPCALGLDITSRSRLHSRPLVAPVENGVDRARERSRVAGRKQDPGLAVANELAGAADVGWDERAPLGPHFAE